MNVPPGTSLTDFIPLVVGRQEELQREADRQIVRWDYTSDDKRDSPRQWWAQRHNLPKTRVLSSRSTAACDNGFDSAGRLVYRHLRTEGGHEFRVYVGSDVYGAVFYGSVGLKLAFRIEMEDGMPKYHEDMTEKGSYFSGKETYKWSGDRLVSVEMDVMHYWRKERMVIRDELEYNEAGDVIAVVQVEPDGTRGYRFRKLPKGVTVKAVLEATRAWLMKEIPEAVARAGIKERVYCLALAYDGEGNGVLPPHLGFGLESERKQWLEQHGASAPRYIWNPAEFHHYEKNHTQLSEVSTFVENCELLNQALEARDSDAPARKLLNEVASALAKTNWSGKLKMTPDFVVYAVDYEMGDLPKNLKAAVPPARLAEFKKHGYL